MLRCPECQQDVSRGARTCPNCDCSFDDEDEEEDIGQDAGIRLLLPVGRSGWAIAAGYLGLISVLCIPSPFALIAGIMAVREISRNPKKHGMGRAWFGIIMGGLGTAILVFGIAALGFEAINKK